MKNDRRSKIGRWAKFGLSAAVVPTLLLGLVAFESADTGSPTISATESLELVKAKKTVPPPAGSGLKKGEPAVGAPGGGASATAEASAAVGEGEAALAASEEFKGDRDCLRLADQLSKAVDRLVASLLGDIPEFLRDEILELIEEIQDAIDEITDLCRTPSGVMPDPGGSKDQPDNDKDDDNPANDGKNKDVDKKEDKKN